MRNIPHKVTGDQLTADEFNDIPAELENAITSIGLSLSAGDLYQLAKTIASYVAVGDFYQDTGTANAYILNQASPIQAPQAYLDGMRVRFRINETNTGASTVNVNSLGVKSILKEDGISELSAGDLPEGEFGEIIYHADLDLFQLASHKYEQTTFVTGDINLTTYNGDKAGWLRCNDSTKTTIGSATSGATLRANADCQQLYKLYWDNYADTDCPVTGGRGATADDDWTANKPIAIPSIYDKVIGIHDVNGTKRLGQHKGAETHTLTVDEMPSHSHEGSTITGIYANYGRSGDPSAVLTGLAGTTGLYIAPKGGSQAHSIMQPTIFLNLYIKL